MNLKYTLTINNSLRIQLWEHRKHKESLSLACSLTNFLNFHTLALLDIFPNTNRICLNILSNWLNFRQVLFNNLVFIFIFISYLLWVWICFCLYIFVFAFNSLNLIFLHALFNKLIFHLILYLLLILQFFIWLDFFILFAV